MKQTSHVRWTGDFIRRQSREKIGVFLFLPRVAVLSLYMPWLSCVHLSVCVRHKSVDRDSSSIESAERLVLVSRMRASFHLSYSVL